MSKKSDARKYYLKNREKLLEKAKEYRSQEHVKARRKEQRAKWYSENKESSQVKAKKRYAEKREKILAHVREYRLENLEKVKSGIMKARYGITIKDYYDLFQSQDGKCAICGIDASKVKRGLAIDHIHGTKKVRGLLCGNCNNAIGHLREDPKIIRKAAEYVEKYK